MVMIYDRREVYKILVREGVAHPRYAILNRNSSEEGMSGKWLSFGEEPLCKHALKINSFPKF